MLKLCRCTHRQGLVVNEWHGVTLSCEDVLTGNVCITSGDEVIARMSFNDGGSTVGSVMVKLVAYIAGQFANIKSQPAMHGEYRTQPNPSTLGW